MRPPRLAPGRPPEARLRGETNRRVAFERPMYVVRTSARAYRRYAIARARAKLWNAIYGIDRDGGIDHGGLYRADIKSNSTVRVMPTDEEALEPPIQRRTCIENREADLSFVYRHRSTCGFRIGYSAYPSRLVVDGLLESLASQGP